MNRSTSSQALPEITELHVLVDYDNAKASPRRERSDVDARVSVQRILDTLERVLGLLRTRPRRVFIDLYGGWRNPDGLPSEDHQRLSRVLTDFVGSKLKTSYVSIALAEAIRECERTMLIGTRDSGDQKMVDGMLVLDTVTRARALAGSTSAIAVMSADVDLVPGLLAASEVTQRRLPLLLIRLLLVSDTRPDAAPQDRNIDQWVRILTFRR